MIRTWLILLIGLTTISPALAANIQLPVVNHRIVIEDDFNQPSAVATSQANGEIFILDGMNRRVGIFSSQGTKISEIQSSEQEADFYQAMGLAVADGKVYLADTSHNRIIVYSLSGELIRFIPLPVIIPERYWPEPVAVTILNKTLIYSDRRHHRLCFVDLEQNTIEQTCRGKRGEQNGEFQFPFQIAIDQDGYLHVSDVINGRIQVLNGQGMYFSQEGKFAVDQLYRPNGIAIDALGYQYVADAYLGTIAVFYKGRFQGNLQDNQGNIIKFSTPVGLWVDSKGLYVVDTSTNQVHRLQLSYELQQEIDYKKTAQSPDMSRKNCIACHFSWGFSEDIDLKDKQGAAPVASLDMCVSCHHGVVFESRQAIPHGGQHPTIYDPDKEKQTRKDNQPREDDIPEHHPLLEDDEMSCTSCHTPHNPEKQQPTLYQDNENSWMRVINLDSDLCESCHESNEKNSREREVKKRGQNHPLGFKLTKPPKGDQSRNFSKDPHLQKGLPNSFVLNGAALGFEQEMVCQSCHQIHGGASDNLVPVTDENGEMCGECHKRQSKKGKKGARKAGVHPVNVKLEEPVKFRGKKTKKVICQSCHSVHDGTPGTPLFPDKIKEAEKLCVDCHERQHAKDEDDAKKKGIHPMNVDLEDPVKIGDKKVKQMGCLSCHAIHSGKPNTPALIEEHKNGTLCENCHENKQKVIGTDHDFRVTAKKSENQFEESPHESGACGACHTLHRGKGKQPFLNAAVLEKKKDRDDSAPKLAVDEMCMNCHQKDGVGEEKPIEHYGHPYKDIIMRSKEDVMPLLNEKTEEIEEMGVISCITCHEPHLWKPEGKHNDKKYQVLDYKKQENIEGNALNSYLRTKGVVDTFCVDCHNIEAMAKFKYYHHEDKVRDIGVDYLK